MSDGSSKTLMVDGRQTVREVLDTLFEKSHCDQNINWSLCETNPELQIGETSGTHERRQDPSATSNLCLLQNEIWRITSSSWSSCLTGFATARTKSTSSQDPTSM